MQVSKAQRSADKLTDTLHDTAPSLLLILQLFYELNLFSRIQSKKNLLGTTIAVPVKRQEIINFLDRCEKAGRKSRTMAKRITIKKYPNRKLYNTDTASYVSYKDIVELIKEGHSVMVVDNRTKQDITRFTLTQILFQKEREFLKNLPENTLASAIKQEQGLISNSLQDSYTSLGNAEEAAVETEVDNSLGTAQEAARSELSSRLDN